MKKINTLAVCVVCSLSVLCVLRVNAQRISDSYVAQTVNLSRPVTDNTVDEADNTADGQNADVINKIVQTVSSTALTEAQDTLEREPVQMTDNTVQDPDNEVVSRCLSDAVTDASGKAEGTIEKIVVSGMPGGLDNESVMGVKPALLEPEESVAGEGGSAIGLELDDLDGLDDLDELENETVYDLELAELENEQAVNRKEGSEPQPLPAQPDISDEQARQIQLEVAVGHADIIFLKNNESLEGVIRDRTDSIISIETQYGLKVCNRRDVEFIDEITEQERFVLLEKLEKLQRYHQRSAKEHLEQEKEKLNRQQIQAQEQSQLLDHLTGGAPSDLFDLTNQRLDEILKEFSQFPPDYWRYYHRKGDVMKTTVRLKRLRRYSHPSLIDTIDLYIVAFGYKMEELDERDGSSLKKQYRDSYEKKFRTAEKRRLTGFNPTK